MAENKKTAKPKKEIKKANTKNSLNSKKHEEINIKEEKKAKKNKIKTWLNNLTVESILIYGISIIIILLLVMIFVSTKNTKTQKGNDIVIKLKGKTITADDLYSEIKNLYGKTIAINLVDEYILNKEYKTTSDMKDQVESTVNSYKKNYSENFESFLEYNGLKDEEELKDILLKEIKLTNATKDYVKKSLSTKELKDYYEKNIHGDIEAKHILVSTETEETASDDEKKAKEEKALEKAKEIITKLQNGEKFEDLAKEYSDDTTTKENGGSLGYFNTGEMVKEFEDAAYALNINEYTKEPVKTTYGYHIILKTAQKEKPTYEKAKDTIIEKLVEEKQQNDTNLSTKVLISLRKKYDMTIKDKKIKKEYNEEIKNVS